MRSLTTLTAVPRRYGAHASCIIAYVQSQCERVHSVDPAERPLVRPPSRSFVPPSVRLSVRPSVSPPSVVSILRSFSFLVYRRHARFTGFRSCTHTHTCAHTVSTRHMFQRASSIIGTHARTHVFHEKECPSSGVPRASNDTATEFPPLPSRGWREKILGMRNAVDISRRARSATFPRSRNFCAHAQSRAPDPRDYLDRPVQRRGISSIKNYSRLLLLFSVIFSVNLDVRIYRGSGSTACLEIYIHFY